MSDQTNPQDAVPTPPSELAAQLQQSGAHAQDIDVTALLKQMASLQAQVDKLNAEKGIPADPVAAAKDDVLAHVTARQAQYPTEDFSPIVKALKELPDSEAITPAHSGRIQTLVTQFVGTHARHELSYVKELADTFHLAILDRALAAVV